MLKLKVMPDDDVMESIYDIGGYCEPDRVFFKRLYLAIGGDIVNLHAYRLLKMLDEQFAYLIDVGNVIHDKGHPLNVTGKKQVRQAMGMIFRNIERLSLELIELTGIYPEYDRYCRRSRRLFATPDQLLPGRVKSRNPQGM